jgi:hypothetical protein
MLTDETHTNLLLWHQKIQTLRMHSSKTKSSPSFGMFMVVQSPKRPTSGRTNGFCSMTIRLPTQHFQWNNFVVLERFNLVSCDIFMFSKLKSHWKSLILNPLKISRTMWWQYWKEFRKLFSEMFPDMVETLECVYSYNVLKVNTLQLNKLSGV